MRLELREISKRFGSHVIFENLSVTLEFQHTLALIGPSGGGKSTLLRLLAGLIPADSGTILFDGRIVPHRENDLRAYRASLGIVFQAFNLFPHLSALENISLPLRQVHGLDPNVASARAFEVLDRFHLADHASKRPSALSGGQRQRVAIARAVAIQPKVLLFDEPTSALDPEMTAEVLDVLTDLRNEGTPLILVTHEMGFARRMADQVAFVAQGKLLEVRAPEPFFENPGLPDIQRFLQRVLRY
jgi:polar amino acid transport system ATP-binding protein